MITSLADSPQRATTSLTVAFGVLNIECSVYTGTEQTRVARAEYLNGDVNIPVGRSPIRKDTGEVVSNTDVVRMATATSGAQVILTDDEQTACTMPRGVADIVTFVKLGDASKYLGENQVQLRPKASKGKPNVAAERAYALLLGTMKRKKVCALVKFALRGPARYGLLYADGSLVYVYSADQVRQARPLDDTFKFTPQEKALAEALIDAVGIDAPTITDDTAPVIQAFVDNKAKGIAAPVPTLPAPVQHDLMGALTASIAATKTKVA